MCLPEAHRHVFQSLENRTGLFARSILTCLPGTHRHICQTLEKLTNLFVRNSTTCMLVTWEAHRLVCQKLAAILSATGKSHWRFCQKIFDLFFNHWWSSITFFIWSIQIYLPGTHQHNFQKLEKLTRLISKSSLCDNYHIRLISHPLYTTFSRNLDNLQAKIRSHIKKKMQKLHLKLFRRPLL